jgi:hypothetical protein
MQRTNWAPKANAPARSGAPPRSQEIADIDTIDNQASAISVVNDHAFQRYAIKLCSVERDIPGFEAASV